jgi:Tfp pilus assembly protein PilV
MNQKKRSRGFSLIEALISSSLILLLIIGTAQLLASSLAAKRRADFHFRASRCGSSKLEYLKSLPPQSPETTDGFHMELFTEESSGETYRAEWEVETIGDAAKKIRLTIFHPAKPGWEAVFHLLICLGLGF